MTNLRMVSLTKKRKRRRKKIKTKAIFFLIFFGFSPVSHGSPLSLEDVLQSTRKHFPLIEQAVAELEAARQKSRAALGNFDATIEGKGDKRYEGYYDGRSAGIKIVKPLQTLNTKLYAGYRVSGGEYPDYEGKQDTLDEGETSLGIAVSLWRDSFIDSKRLKLRNAEQKAKMAEEKLRLSELKYQSSAMKLYWEWVSAGNVLRVRQDLLEIAVARTDGLEKRVSRGDLARIYLTENNQYILKRRADVLKAKQLFEQLSYELSLFYRNNEGEPQVIKIDRVPKDFGRLTKMDLSVEEKKLLEVMKNSPQVRLLEREIQTYQNELEFGENLLKPRVDFNLETTNDRGEMNDSRDSKTLDTREVRGMVTLSIPIERNLGEGNKQAARAKLRALGQQLKYLEQYIRVTLDRLVIQLNIANDIVDNATKEIELASILEKAEKKRFRQGASDFFVINIREENTASARIKKVDAYLKYQKAYADYLFLMLMLDLERSVNPKV